ncbi:MAG: apolipoprotein N-acyltransferase, partial [Thermoanaerobaculia bacterium]
VPWVVPVMVKYGGLPTWIGISLYVLMSAYLATYGGLFALIVYRIRRAHPVAIWFVVPAAWVAVEFLRTYIFTGFPWHLIATALIDTPPLIILARVIGPYGVGFLTLFPAAALGWILATNARPRLKATAAIASAVLLLGWLAAGAIMLRSRDLRSGAPFTLALLQPNITQTMRWDPQSTLTLYEKMMRMSVRTAEQGARTIVWPESTVPLTFLANDFYRDGVALVSERWGADVILGSVAEDPEDMSRLWNAAYLVSGGEVKGRYDKIRLVPFGEYVPLRKVIFFAEKLVRAVGEFQFGTSAAPLEGRHRYGLAICYEIVFPQLVADQVRNGSDVLVTITNDAWFDQSAAPRQHLDMARLRAVETDRWLLRAATTGISALVDPAGRIIEMIPYGEEGAIVGRAWARQSITPYVRFGDWFAWLAALTALMALALPRLFGKVG